MLQEQRKSRMFNVGLNFNIMSDFVSKRRPSAATVWMGQIQTISVLYRNPNVLILQPTVWKEHVERE